MKLQDLYINYICYFDEQLKNFHVLVQEEKFPGGGLEFL